MDHLKATNKTVPVEYMSDNSLHVTKNTSKLTNVEREFNRDKSTFVSCVAQFTGKLDNRESYVTFIQSMKTVGITLKTEDNANLKQ